MNKIEFTDELHNSLVDLCTARAALRGYKIGGKRFLDLQCEIFVSAVATIDFLNGSPDQSCITPRVYFSIFRGELIEKIKQESSETQTNK